MREEENKYTVSINVEVRQKYGHGGLSVREEITVNANGFMEIASILAKFHELAEKMKVEK